MKKQQIIVIHGAGAFAGMDRTDFISALKEREVDLKWFRRGTGDWKSHLEERLGESYEVLFPKMPDPDNPQYEAWRVWFEKILPELDEELIVVGHSLGGLFLQKYFSENTVDKSIRGLFTVAAPYFGRGHKWEKSGFVLPEDLSKVMQAENVFLYYSKDDELVPFSDLSLYKEKLPEALVQELDSRGHFTKDDFPEIVDDIKSI